MQSFSLIYVQKQESLPSVMLFKPFLSAFRLHMIWGPPVAVQPLIFEIHSFLILSFQHKAVAVIRSQIQELTLSCGSSSSRREIIPAAKQDHSQFWTLSASKVNTFSSKPTEQERRLSLEHWFKIFSIKIQRSDSSLY